MGDKDEHRGWHTAAVIACFIMVGIDVDLLLKMAGL